MNQYTYFVLGILLGIGLAVFYFMNREEKNEIIVQCYKEKFNIEKIVWLFKISCFYTGRKAEHIEFNSKLWYI